MRKNIHAAQHKRLIDLLREVRIKAGLTQTQLAERIGRDQSFVSRYEGGDRRLEILEVREVCQALGLSFVEFAKKLEDALK